VGKILITGSTGFIGTELVNKLKSQGHEVIGLSSRDGDITESSTLSKFLDEDVHHVYHLAGAAFVPESWENPAKYIDINVVGTTSVLEYCKAKNCSLTFISSYVYGNAKKLPINEKAEISVPNPYALSKKLAEDLCLFYIKNFNLKINIIRPFNVYGPTQPPHFLIPTVVLQAINDDQIEVLDLSPKRDYIFIDDLIEALVSARTSVKSEIINIGSGTSFSVGDVINFTQKLLGTSKPVVSKKVSRNNEISETLADITLAKEKLNWEPKVDMMMGLNNIITHIKSL